MSDWPKVIPPYKPGCPWNDWLHAIAEKLKEDPDHIKKMAENFKAAHPDKP